MSSIGRLSIRGIRSFGSETEESIEFYKPLTVIVGPNGCGKTTIIECLKYVTTGSLPPGSKNGQFFVHDPKLADVTEVNAGVRMMFKNRARQRMFIGRSFKLTQKKTKREFKALDGVVKMRTRDGKEVSQTHRCSDLDKAIPEYLGVSRAILENVIFCHQEDSNWPLQEGAVLKKRFDEIFESTRYTKALDALKKHRKATLDTYKDAERDLKVVETQLKIAKSKRMEEKRELEEYDQIQKEQDSLIKELEEEERTLAELKGKMASFSELEQEINKIDMLMEHKNKDLQEKQAELDDESRRNDWSVEELEDARAKSSASLLKLSDQKSHYNSKVPELESQVNSLQVESNNVNLDCARLSEKLKEKETAIVGFGRMHMGLVGKWGFEPYDYAVLKNDDSGEEVENIVRSVRILKEEKDAQLEQEKTSSNAELDREQQKVNAARMHENEVAAHIRQVSTKISEVQTRIVQISKELQQLGSDGTRTQSEVKRVTDQLEKVKADQREENIDAKIEQFKREETQQTEGIKEVEEKIKSTSQSLEKMEKQQVELAEFRLKRESLERLQSDLRSELENNMADLRHVTTTNVPPNLPCPVNLESVSVTDGGSLVSELVDYLEKLEQCRNGEMKSEKELLRQHEDVMLQVNTKETQDRIRSESLQSQIESLKSKLPKREFFAILEKYEAKVLADDGMPGVDSTDGRQSYHIDRIVEMMDKERNECRSRHAVAQNSKTLIKNQIARAQESNKCPTCLQGLNDVLFSLEQDLYDKEISSERIPKGNHQGLDALKAQLMYRFADGRFERYMQETKKKVELVESEWENINKYLPTYRQVQSLEGELKQYNFLEAQQAFAKKKQSISEKIENSKFRLKHEISLQLSEVQSLLPLIKRLEEKSLECKRTSDELKHMELLLGIQGGNANMDLTSKRDELRQLHSTRNDLQSKQEKLRKKVYALQTQTQVYLKQTNDLQGHLIRLEKATREREALEDERKTLKVQESELKLQCTELNSKKLSLARASKQVSDTYDRLKDSHIHTLKQLSRQVSDISEDYVALRAHAATVRRHIRENVAQRLKEAKEKHSAKEDEISRMKGILEDNKGKLNACTKELEHYSEVQRKIKSLIDTKEIEKLLQDLESQRSKLAEKLSRATGSAQMAGESLDFQERKVESLREKSAFMEGRLEVHQQNIQNCKEVLLSKDYRGVDDRYKANMIRSQTTKLACADLEKYQNTLDRALMQFHHMKIAEINKRIRDIWQVTYKGGDIDRIELKTEITKTARGSYNYRVVMTKGDTELDMRGRSSAGQRCLASLVIRLALAETFSVNCGILALDEPTTNLDDHNKHGLAIALGQLLASRKQQQNFQLIIITHDEEFVDMLRQEQVQEGGYYFRVSRHNVDGRYLSEIRKQEWD